MKPSDKVKISATDDITDIQKCMEEISNRQLEPRRVIRISTVEEFNEFVRNEFVRDVRAFNGCEGE